MNFPLSAGYCEAPPSAVLRVAGSDAAPFLQGQFTNDLRKLPSAAAVYGLWLEVKGRVVADSHILTGSAAGEFLLFSAHSPAEALRRRLEGFVIADDVALEDQTSQWTAFALVGEGTGAWLAAEARPGRFFPGRRSSGENWEWLIPHASTEAVRALELEGARRLSAVDLERIRIRSCIPAIPGDIGPRELPNEGGLERDAVAYDKGCYLGQEVMMRLKTRGRVRRRLARVLGEGPAPALPAPLWREGKRTGELRSAASLETGSGWIGLALLPVDSAPKSAGFSLNADGSGPVRPVETSTGSVDAP